MLDTEYLEKTEVNRFIREINCLKKKIINYDYANDDLYLPIGQPL
ncbi:hypothetical protein [Methanobrevibacter oralis]|nr:hypothetical protein [Methanobrevibacter oralis]